jgi:ABC-type multidrug transport system fused ATPase/permease subunit
MQVDNLGKIYQLLNSEEKISILFISFIFFISITFDLLSFAIIVPVFDIIFLDNIPSLKFNNFLENYFTYLFNNKLILLLTIFFVFLIKNLFLIYFNYEANKFYIKHEVRCRNELFNLFINQEYIFYLKKESSNYITKIIDDVGRYKIYLIFLVNIIVESIFVIILIILLSYYNFYLIFFFFVSSSIIFLLYINLVKKRLFNWSIIRQSNISYMQRILIEGFTGIKDIIIYNLGKMFNEKLNNFNLLASKAAFKSDFLNNISRLWIEILVIFVVIVPIIFLVVIDQSIKQYLSIFTLYTLAIFRIIPSANRLIVSYQQLVFNKSSFLSVYEQFSNKQIAQRNFTDLNFKECIEFKDVNYEFSDRSKVLFDNINIKIYKNQIIGIKGPNGSGKSTFLNLLSGFLKPTSGDIILDNKYKIFNNYNWFCRISFVHQDVFLFSDTIKNNICLKYEEKEFVDEDKLENVLNTLKIKSFFSSLPLNLNTFIDADGLKLSGGQKQLISIARAIYKESEIIIFDEANSALDSNYQNIFKQILMDLKGKKTIIIVSHDLSFLKFCDKVYEVKNKNILEC